MQQGLIGCRRYFTSYGPETITISVKRWATLCLSVHNFSDRENPASDSFLEKATPSFLFMLVKRWFGLIRPQKSARQPLDDFCRQQIRRIHRLQYNQRCDH